MTAKILLVEDDRALREALGDTLELGGYAYHAVECAEAALQALEQESYGLVVSDVNMPGMDGHALQALIRQRYPQVPVLLMTAYGAVERAVEAMRQEPSTIWSSRSSRRCCSDWLLGTPAASWA